MNPLTSAVSNFLPQIAQTADAIGDSLVDAGAGFVNEQTEGLKDAEDAFRNESVASGFTELMDALSPGTAGANALASLGLIPNDGPGKELVSAAFNMTNAAFAPAAFKDLADAFGQMNGPVKGNVAASHTPPAPQAQYTQTCEGPKRPAGYLTASIKFGIGADRMLRPGMDMAMILACPTSALAIGPMRIFQNMFENLLLKAIEGGHCSKPEKPMAERAADDEPSIEDILGDTSLSFEDMLFMIMSKVMQDMQKEIRAEVEKLEKISSAIDGKSDGSKQAGQADGQQGGQGGGDMLGGFIGSLTGAASAGRGTAGAAGGATGMKLPLAEAGGFLDMVKPFVPMLAPMVGAACSAIPGIGPFLSASMPVILPIAVELVSGGLKAADGPVNSMVNQATQGGGGGGGVQGRQVAGGAGASGKKHGNTIDGKSKEELQDSRTVQQEKLKMMTQKLTEMQQAISNIMNNFHKSSMNTINNIR